MIHGANIYFSDDEWDEIQSLKKDKKFTWREIIFDWMKNNN